MPSPKIAICSTCLDVGELRDLLFREIQLLNYEPVLSELNGILYNPSEHTHVSCVRAIEEVDIVVFILSERYGGQAVPQAFNLIKLEEEIRKAPKFYNQLNNGHVSITQLEILKAIEKRIPVYTFISEKIYNFHELYEKNKDKPELDNIDFPTFEKRHTVPYIFEFYNFLRKKEANNAFYIYKNGNDLIDKFKQQMGYLFRDFLKERRERIAQTTKYIQATVVKHKSVERSRAFDELFTQINKDDTIKILGTGVTTFLSRTEDVERYLENNNKIKILLINDQIIKSEWACSSQEFIARLNEAQVFQKKETIDELEAKTFCPLSNLNVLIDTKHFVKYYKRKSYIDEMKKSYTSISEYQKKIQDNNWPGSLEVRHFFSFVPMSITAVFPDDSPIRVLLAEFIIPFTDSRILMKSTLDENTEIYNLFLSFFDETWKRAEPINLT